MKVILMVWLQGLVSVSEQSILQLLIYLSLEQTKKKPAQQLTTITLM